MLCKYFRNKLCITETKIQTIDRTINYPKPDFEDLMYNQ